MVGRQGDEMGRHRCFAEGAGQPGAGGGGVGHRFLGGEGLGRHQYQGAGGVQLAGKAGKGVAVDIGEEMRRHHPATGQGQRFGGHARAEVGAADTDVQHRGEALAGRPVPRAVMHRADEFPHPVAFGSGEAAGILAAGLQAGIDRAAQRHVHRRAMLGAVDRRAGEQPVAEPLQP